MTIAHLTKTIQDKKTGRVVLGATVTLCNPNTTTPIDQLMFSDPAMTVRFPNPFVCANGKIDVYVGDPVTIQLKIQKGTSIDLLNNVPVLPYAENFLVSPTPLKITNSPGTNKFLRGTDSTNVAWADLSDIFPGIDAVVLGWFVSQSFQIDNIVRDSNGAMLTADVTWPDLIAGTYTADTVSSLFPGKVDAWNVTRILDSRTMTYTQFGVTRDDDGDVVEMPLVQVDQGS